MSLWKYNSFFDPQIKQAYQITINEGNTPTVRFNSPRGYKCEIFLKREDLNPNGSHKDRSVAYQLSAHIQDGKRDFVISSSGNSAISTIAYTIGLGVNVHIFLSTKLSANKVSRLEKALGSAINSESIKISKSTYHFHRSLRPLSDAFRFAKENGYTFLRGSTDDYAVEGLKSIAFELEMHPLDLGSGAGSDEQNAVFLPLSSGTTAIGVYRGFRQLLSINRIDRLPMIHIVQSSKVHPVAEQYDSDFVQTESSIADSIVDRVVHRRVEISQALAGTNGAGWVVSDKEITLCQAELAAEGVQCSNEGAMSLAGLYKALAKGYMIERAVCIITGTV